MLLLCDVVGREYLRTREKKEVVNEVLFDHQGHIKSLSGKLHFNRNLEKLSGQRN